MKKYLLFVLAMLLFIPTVYAVPNICTSSSTDGQGFCNTNRYDVGVIKDVANSSGYGITEWQYVVNGQTAFCIDAANQYPKYIDRARSLDMSSSRDRALAAIYRIYLIEVSEGGNHTTLFNLANDAMRLYIHNSGNGISGGYYGNPTPYFMGYANDFLSSNPGGNKGMLKKMYCAGVYAAGGPSAHYNSCANYIDSLGIDMNIIKLDNFNIKLFEDTSEARDVVDRTKKYSKELTFKVSGTENIDKVLAAFPSLKNTASMTVQGCEVDADSAAQGFTCRLSGNSGNLLETKKQKVIIESDKLILKDTSVKIKVKYRYKFPYDISSVTMLRCSGTSGVCQGDLPTQRFVILDKDKVLSATATVTAEVPSACQYEVVDGKAIYNLNGKEVTEYEYLHAGCCEVNPNYLRDQDAILEYKNYCMENDVVFFENECGTRSKLGKNVIDTASSGSVVTTTCTNESYVDYTHSYIWQLPMEKVMERLTRAEHGAYADNLRKIYENEGITNYQDKTYVRSEVSGGGKTLPAIDGKNNYCMLFTSEENNLYFPGTSIASSGRFFIFNELNKEECVNSINPGANCFRQPYVTGNIKAVMHTNVEKWEKDYLAAIEAEKAAYTAWKESNSDGDKQLYDIAVLDRKTLEKYKIECEQRNDIETFWDYNLAPTVDFKYKQKVYGGTERTETITETVNMAISKEAVNYWPKVTTEASVVPGSKTGTKHVKNYNISYGDHNETTSFDTNSNYGITYTQTLYYKPDRVTYATLPTGRYVVAIDEYQTDRVDMLEAGLKVGYVYNVKLTTYEGIYSTAFTIDHVGHLDKDNHSNVQKTLDKYKQDNALDKLSSECVYCNQEGQFSRVCEACPDPENPDLTASYVYRTISLSDVTPNDRDNTNWSDAKGKSAEARIQSLSGDQIVSSLAATGKDIKVSTLGEISTEVKTENLAVGDIYNDSTREYLEYEFNLTTNDMQMIKKNTRKAEFDYSEMIMCGTSNVVTGKSADATYCFTCNQDGKECKSTFIDAYGESSVTTVTRDTKWKYFINNKWEFGKMSTIDGFENGRYPDPLNQEAYIKKYSNWP